MKYEKDIITTKELCQYNRPAFFDCYHYIRLIGFVLCMHVITNAQQEVLGDDFLEISNNEISNASIDQQLMDLSYLSQHPLDINTATKEALSDLFFLSAYQIEQIILYRKRMGRIQNTYEINAISGFSSHDVQRLLPYIRMHATTLLTPTKKGTFAMLKDGTSTLYLRTRMNSEKRIELNRGEWAPKGYLGYFYRSPQKLEMGWLLENDRGEYLLQEGKVRKPDFLSFHIYLKNVHRRISALAIGDFKILMGQGLIMNGGFRVGKSALVNRISTVGREVLPFKSINEFNFMRGLAATINLSNSWRASIFVSQRNLDASMQLDSMTSRSFVQTIRKSGLHVTAAEKEGQNALSSQWLGGILSYDRSFFKIDANYLFNKFMTPMRINNWESWTFISRQWYSSLSYKTTGRSVHLFGETAIDDRQNKATLNGLIWSPDKRLDVSLLHRFISSGYQSLWSNAFVSGSKVQNEKGVYLGFDLRWHRTWSLRGYYDLWEKPRPGISRDLPKLGNTSFIRLTYTKRKKMELYIQSRFISKSIVELNTKRVRSSQKSQVNVRIHLSYKLTKALEWRTRLERNSVQGNENSTLGFLWYQDLLYRPMKSRLSFTARWALFDTDGYDARIYAYENDQLNLFSIPFYSGSGMKYYVNFRYKYFKNQLLEFRWAQTFINKEKAQTEVGIQLRFKW